MAEIGIDEGGVLQALQRPVGEQTITTREYNKKGLVEREVVTKLSVSVGDVTFVLIMLGVLRFASLPPEQQQQMLAGPFTGPILKKLQESDNPLANVANSFFYLLGRAKS